ncbi:kazal-type serine protease inhibitor domain-containing protein 1-like isoform X1 [Cyclopterus lumpus]|uniref:kazal-type serine protease inhibitor domain-containing protein 1-like isoform X1 n=1 Tax=Cyclopterus lumpus TaxID=8103 RepID=UPI0014864E29|nr:kazal-type serine protease inhibitor domain-containing protein 1-like isoform X1 [Cyclopterus lumpus]
MPGLSGLVLLALCLNLHTCRALPDPLGGCGPCEPDLCPQTRGCRAGLVPDPCGCCTECGNLEGQTCDQGDRSVFYGLCGSGMRCLADPGPGGRGDEAQCACEDQKVVCGADGVTYMNMCQFREAAFSRPDLQTRGRGPCKTVPVIKVPPHSQVNGTGSSLAFLCEVFAFPMALVEWRKEGRDVVLPGDDPHISVQSRGGPLKFEVTSWLQIEGAEPEDSGTYRCVARNNVGSVSASAVLGVLGAEELSSYLANSVSEMKQLMDPTDYDQDFY